MLTAVVLLAACAAAAPADKPTPPADVFDSPEFKAKVAIEQVKTFMERDVGAMLKFSGFSRFVAVFIAVLWHLSASFRI